MLQLQQSEYWNAGFDNCIPATGLGQHATAVRMPGDPFGAFGGSGTDALRDRALHGGGGNDDLRLWAFASAHSVPGGVRAAYIHSEHLRRDRALHELGGHPQQGQASAAELGEFFERARAPHAVPGDQHGQARVSNAALGEQCGQDRASQVLHDGLYGYSRAQHMSGDHIPAWELHDGGRGRSCTLPEHDVGGGGVGEGMSRLRMDGMWGESTA